MIRTVCIGLLVLAPLALLAAHPLNPDECRGAFNLLRDAVYNDESIDVVLRRYDSALAAVNAAAFDERERNYRTALVEQMAGRGEKDARRFAQAEWHLLRGLVCVDLALKDSLFSDGCRLKSELVAQQCIVKWKLGKFIYMLRNGLSILGMANKAWALDSSNAKAAVMVASAKVYPPPIYGGDPRKGIDLMRKVLGMERLEPDDLFNAYSGIGISYARLGRRDEAIAWLSKALALYPGNNYVNEQYRAVAP